MVRPEGLEPPAYWFEASRSIRLSYGRVGIIVAFRAAHFAQPPDPPIAYPESSPGFEVGPVHLAFRCRLAPRGFAETVEGVRIIRVRRIQPDDTTGGNLHCSFAV